MRIHIYVCETKYPFEFRSRREVLRIVLYNQIMCWAQLKKVSSAISEIYQWNPVMIMIMCFESPTIHRYNSFNRLSHSFIWAVVHCFCVNYVSGKIVSSSVCSEVKRISSVLVRLSTSVKLCFLLGRKCWCKLVRLCFSRIPHFVDYVGGDVFVELKFWVNISVDFHGLASSR